MRKPYAANLMRTPRRCFDTASHYSLRVEAIVNSFEPRRSQSSENRLKSTVVLAALKQALRTEAATSRRNSTSLLVARTDSLAVSEEVDVYLRDRRHGGRRRDRQRASLLAGASSLSKRESRTAKRPASPCGLTQTPQQWSDTNVGLRSPAIAFALSPARRSRLQRRQSSRGVGAGHTGPLHRYRRHSARRRPGLASGDFRSRLGRQPINAFGSSADNQAFRGARRRRPSRLCLSRPNRIRAPTKLAPRRRRYRTSPDSWL